VLARLRLAAIVTGFFAVITYGIADDLGLLPPTTPTPALAPASRHARADIPAGYLRWYQRAARTCSGLGWEVLAAVGKVESDHGRARLPGVRSGANWAGAAGPMQLGIGGKAGRTWQRYRTDADRDGRASVYDPPDAITAAARKLCRDGARRPGGLVRALYAYNHSRVYVARVLAVASRYQARLGAAR
jgi:hypothetical protein